MMNAKDIPRKANRVLYFITLSLVLIFVRVWYLQTRARDVHVQRARTPRQRVIVEKARRGAIYDRFGLPLAINHVQYNAAICYGPIRDVPRIRWENGKKIYARQEHIEQVAQVLAAELEMDAQDIEDLIHCRAALFPNAPYVIQADIDEQTHARLKMLEHKYPGIVAQIGEKRVYPQGKVGGEIVGYLGAIPEKRYLSVADELIELEEFLNKRREGIPICLPKAYSTAKELKNRWRQLKEQSYSINDRVGRAGIESYYDELLRGAPGKTPIEVDVRGQIVRHLPGAVPPRSGSALNLSISAELQAFAENLLLESEKIRDENFPHAGKDYSQVTGPWIKGGAIVALKPQTGEVVALASTPRIDPNDFASGHPRIHRWLETERLIGAIWDGRENLYKEAREQPLTWQHYLDAILSKNGKTKAQIRKVYTVKQALDLLEQAEVMRHLSGKLHMREALQKPGTFRQLNGFLDQIGAQEDKLLFLDLLRLAVDPSLFHEELRDAVGSETLDQYRGNNQAVTRLLRHLQEYCEKIFHQTVFAEWRREHFPEFLKAKRIEERKSKKRSKPYYDYLVLEEKYQFEQFWQKHRYTLLNALVSKTPSSLSPLLQTFCVDLDDHPDMKKLRRRFSHLSPELAFAYLKTMRTYDDLNEPLWGKYRLVKSENGVQYLKHLARAFYAPSSYGFGKSHAFRTSSPPGSAFKLATGYTAIMEHVRHSKRLNPLTLIDESGSGKILGYFESGAPIPKTYKHGRLVRSHSRIGKVDFLSAMERSSNIYFSILASDLISSPNQFIESAQALGYGSKTGIDLPGEYPGVLPTDLRDNQTGLYAFAIGQHAFDATPLQTAVMFSAVANGGKIITPHVLHSVETSAENQTLHPFAPLLYSVGMSPPLFTQVMPKADLSSKPTNPPYRATIPMPPDVRSYLLESLHRVVNGPFGSARPGRIKALLKNPQWMRDYRMIKNSMVGKTSTAEFRYYPTLDRESNPITCKNISFAGISFSTPDAHTPAGKWSEPELVVIAFLRFADYGKEAAPLCIEVVKKWRELSQKYDQST